LATATTIMLAASDLPALSPVERVSGQPHGTD
jgi:hypothetical protein